jgi:glucosamine-6-phosphate deaminase
MPRPLSTLAPDWWDYTTLDPELLRDASRLTIKDLEQPSRPGFQILAPSTRSAARSCRAARAT